MATVNADTWATELGVLSAKPPRLITTGKEVERGASGGVSLLGSLASLGGATLVAILASLFLRQVSQAPGMELSAISLLYVSLAVISGGLFGSFFDSLLGATVQAIYTCPQCHKETERYPRHSCGAPTLHTRGWLWLNNDMVNFSASVTGAGIAIMVWYLLNSCLF
jgi:uncharacterized membrane protein